jgi:hypothetical protein
VTAIEDISSYEIEFEERKVRVCFVLFCFVFVFVLFCFVL